MRTFKTLTESFGTKFSALMNFFFSPQGRVTRAPMWILLGITLLSMPFVVLGSATFLEKVCFFGIFWLCPLMKRFYDLGREYWWALLLFLGPIIAGSIFPLMGLACLAVWLPFALWSFIELFCRRGAVEFNAYGPDPLEAK